MPQGPIAVQQSPAANGNKSALYVNGAKVIKASAGMVAQINVLVAGAAGAVYDCATTAAAAAVTANQIAVIPATVGPVEIRFPALVGIVVVPGAGQVISVSYD